MRQRKKDPTKHCAACGKRMSRKRFNNRLEDMTSFSRRKYCNRRCMAKGMVKVEVTRGALYQRARKFRLPNCQECGTTQNLHLHHVNGNPSDNRKCNRMTLCGSCHTRWHWDNGKTITKSERRCSVCNEPARKLQWCQKHYQRYRKYGSPYLTKKKCGSSYVVVEDRG